MAKSNASREEDTGWMAEGRCRTTDPELFFPTDGTGVLVAKRICATCPVQESCLDYALANRINEGIWGGASQRERLRLLRADRGRREAPAQ